VIGPSGLVYFIAEGHNSTNYRTNHTLWAMNPDGTANWTAVVASQVPINLGDGDEPHEQQVRWSFGALALAVDASDNVYAGGDAFRSYHGKNGTLRWAASIGDVLGGCCVSGSMVLVGNETSLISLNTTSGAIKWRYSTTYRPWYPAIGPSGEIVFGTARGKVVSLSPAGSLLWEYAGFAGQGLPSYPYAQVLANPAIDAAGNVYVGSKFNMGSEWVSLTSAGAERWKITGDDLRDAYSSPCLADDGNVYFCTEGSAYWIVDRDTGAVKTFSREYFVQTDVVFSSSVIDDRGVQYVGTMKGTLFAIQTTSTGMDDSAAWPCRGGALTGSMAR